MYGLVDGPLLFQLALLDYLVSSLKLCRSLHDDNYLYRTHGWDMVCIIVIHVDDLLICATRSFMDYAVRMIEKKFGK